MDISIKPRTGPINRVFLGAGLLTTVSYLSWPGVTSSWEWFVLPVTLALGAATMSATAIQRLIKDFRLRRNIAISQMVSDDHGSAREASAEERAEAGMDQPNGDLLGIDDDGVAVYRPPNLPFGIIEISVGGGKTAALVIVSILHRAKMGYSMLIAAPKDELPQMLGPALAKMGIEVWSIGPKHRHVDGVQDVEVNLYQPLIDALFGEGDARKDAVKYAADYAVIHYPIDREEKNPYFAQGSRRAIVLCILSEALINPAGCTPTAVYQLLTDPVRMKARLRYILGELEGLDPDDPVVGFLKTEARNLLNLDKKNEENLGAFLEGASQRLLAFNPAGHLAQYGAKATKRITELRERQVVAFVPTPLAYTREFAPLTSLLNSNVIAACKAEPTGHPIHIVAEEALNYKFSELVSDMETMRQLGVSADFYIQSFAGLEKVYGKLEAQAIEAMADVRIYSAVNSPARAKFISEMLSDTTLRKQDASYQTSAETISVSSRELSRPLQKANEILSMPKGRAWVFVRGMNPMNLRMVHWAQVAPWRDWVGESPLPGTTPPRTGKPLVTINYPTDKDARDE